MPDEYNLPRYDEKGFVKMPIKRCKTYIYTNYLPPGNHSVVIVCPKTKRVFVKEILVDLNQSDFFPEIPGVPRVQGEKPVVIKKITRSNVWRRWREDTEEKENEAFYSDIMADFDPSLFLKDEEDIEAC